MTTSQQTFRLIRRKPHTKAQLAGTLGVSTKTVGNILGRIHKQYEMGAERFAAFRTPNRAETLYAIVDMPAPKTKKVGQERFKFQSSAGVLEGGIYNTVVYKR